MTQEIALDSSLTPNFFDMIEKIKEYYKRFKIRSRNDLTLSLTHRCSWRCVFCYKGCPRKGPDMTAEDLKLIVPKLLEERLSFTLTGGEPTLHEAWRSVAAYTALRGQRIRMVTNASKISDEDIDFIARTLGGIKLSIHALTPKIAYKMTGSKEQRGLEVLKKLSQMVDDENFKIAVVTLVLRPNVHEIIPLLEEFENVYEETGNPEKIELGVPSLSGSMLRNMDLYPSQEEWESLKREIEGQGFNLNICFGQYGRYISLPPYNGCFELEPDGYGYMDRIRVGSWREHSPRDLLFYWYKKGYQLVYEALKRGETLRELPNFRVKKRTYHWLRLKAVDYFETEEGCVIEFKNGKLLVSEGKDYHTLLLIQMFPIEKLQVTLGEEIMETVNWLLEEGYAKLYEAEVPHDVEIVEEG